MSPWKGNTSVGGGLQLGPHGPMPQWAPLALAALPPPRGTRAWRPGLAGRCYAYFTIKIQNQTEPQQQLQAARTVGGQIPAQEMRGCEGRVEGQWVPGSAPPLPATTKPQLETAHLSINRVTDVSRGAPTQPNTRAQWTNRKRITVRMHLAKDAEQECRGKKETNCDSSLV